MFRAGGDVQPGNRGPRALPVTTAIPPCHHGHPACPQSLRVPVPACPPVRVSPGSPRQECFPLPSESGGRNCWNSDRLSNSANFILQTKGSVPALLPLPACGGQGWGAPEFLSRGPPGPAPTSAAPAAKSHFQRQREVAKLRRRAGISLRDFPAGLFPLQVHPQPVPRILGG